MSVDYAAQFDEWARKNRVGVMTTPTPVSTPSVTPSASSIRTGGGADYAALFDDWARRNRPGTTGAGATTPAPSVTIPTTQPASASYAADDAAIGQYGKGNIDLYHRPQYHYNDGAIATVESMSFNENGKEILVPTIAFDNAGKAVKLTDEQAIDRYHRTGEYLGKFNTVAEADSYAEQLHRAQDYYYNGRNATPAAKTAPSLENLSSGYGGYMPSLNPTSKRGNGYMGYGMEVKLPEATENDSSTHAWRGLAKEIGSYVDSVRDTNAAKGIQTAVGNENLGREDNSRYGQYLRLMTPEEREKATRPESQGGLSEKERGAYIRSLNLDERILSGVEKERSEKASQYETRTAEAKKSDSLYGRLIATFVTGDYSYSAKDFQGSDPGPAPEKMRFLTEKQKDTLNAYIKAGDFQAVGDYYKTLEPSLNAQHAQWGTELARDLTANSTLADVVSVPVTGALNSFGGIPGYLATAGHVLRDMATGNYTPIDKNSEAYAIPRLSQALQEGVNERISTIQDPNARYVARLATSGLSSGVSNLIQLYTGQALGLQGDALAQFVTLAMSASAGGQDAYRNLDEGQNNGDALINATASAAIEYWTEHMTTSRWIENLGKLKSGKLSKADIVKMLSTQTGAEMWEEVVGNVADQSWDRLYNGENSVFSRRVQELTGTGLSREDAETQAFKELYVDQSVEAALSVAFSMILMDGAPAISNHISYVDAGRNLRQAAGQDAVQNEIEKGLLFSSDNPAHTLAEQLQSAQAAGGSQAVTNRDLGRLSFLNGQAVSELLGGIEDGDNEALKYTARAVLEQARDNPSDRVSVTQIRMLRELHEGARDGQARTDTERSERENLFNEFRQDFFSQIERIDLDAAGNPLVSYAEAVNEIRARMPDATDEQIRQFYGQYRDATRTVLFGGHRLTRAQFRSLMQEATPEKLSGVDLDRLFNMAILDTLDGSDAFERYLPGVTEGARQQSDSSRRENFPIEESDIFPESSENAPQSPETANVDADSVPSEKAIDERVATPANSTAAAESVTPGLDYEDAVTAEAVNSLNGKTADKIDTLGKLLGKRIRFANSVAEGAANGQISGNDITLERSLLDEGAEQDSLVWKILGHELTHGVQQDTPETYAAFRDAIISEESFRAHVADIRSAYEMRGLSITEEAALDEAVADYGGDIMRNTDTAERFIERNRQNRTLLQKIRDAIVNLVRKLTGAEKHQVQTVQSLFDAALDAAAQKVREDATQTDSAATQDNGDIRFAIKTADSGEKYVRADRQVIFGNNPRSWGEQVLLMTDDGDALLLTKTTAGKLSSRYRGNGTSLSENEYMTKLEAGVHIDELARISQSTHTTADKNSRHGDFASKGWSYRRAFFQDSDGAYYSLDISVAQNDTGNIVYNIGNVKRRNFPTARNASNGSSANSGAQGGEISSANNIPQTAAESNSKPKFSLKGTESVTELEARLQSLTDRDEELLERQNALQSSQEYKDLNAAFTEARKKSPSRFKPSAEVKAAQQALSQWREASGYQEISNERKRLSDEIHDLQKAVREQRERAAESAKAEYRRTFTPETASRYAKKAAQAFGITDSFERAGYLTVNGQLLDFSRDQQGRAKDHREISDVLDFLPDGHGQSDGPTAFEGMGNIRLQSGGIELVKAPNAAQVKELRRFFRSRNGQVVVDFAEEDGSYIGSLNYEKGTSADRILRNIDAYFETGNIPHQSLVSQFHYSLKGTENSEQLRKLVEENRRLTERLKFWQAQTRLSDPKQPYRAVIGEVNKAAKSILTQFDSALDVQDIRPAVLELVQHLNKGPEGEGAWSSADNDAAEQAAVAEWISQANGMSRTLAAQVINHARVLTNDADMKVVRDIREEVRKAPLSYNRAAIGERTNFSEFWKRNRNRLKLQNKNGASIESHWQEWTQRFGEEWFPSNLSDETEMLLCLDQIMDALDHIQPEYINPHSADMLDAIEKCREVILDIAMDTGPRARTFADRQKAARSEAYQKGVEEGRRRAQAAVESAKKAVEKERQQSRRNMDAYKERVKERNRAREAAQINRQRWVQLNRLMKRLNNRKMLQADRTLLNAIYENLEAIANNTLGITPEDIEANMRELWMKISEYGGTNEDGESIPGRNPMYSERFIRNPKAFAEVLKQRRQTTERMKELERETAELSPEQLQRVCEFLMAFDHAQATIDQLINARDKRDLALQAVLLQEHLRGATPFLANGLITHMLRPVSFATRATGYAQNDPFVNSMKDLVDGERIRDDYKRRAYALLLNRFAVNLGNSPSVTKQMSAAEQRQLVQRIKTLMKTFSGKDAAAEQNLIEIHGTDPGAEAFSDKPVTAHITKGMRMGLYLHSKNKDNMRHITQGGFKVPSVEKGGYEFYRKEQYTEAYADNHAVHIRLTKAEVARIVSGMSVEEKAFADAVSYYYDTMSKKELTRVHEMLKGWSPFNVENYMPIETDDAFNKVDYENMQTDGTMSTPGFSLERVKSGKPVILRDLNLTAFNSVEQHAKFVGLAIPVRNMNKLLNWSRVTRGSVEQAVERMYGKETAEKIRARFEQRSGQEETALALPGEQAQKETDTTLSVLREVLGWKKTNSLKDFLNENAQYESVRKTIGDSLGDRGKKYIDKLMKDMTGQKKSQDDLGHFWSTLSSNLAGAALTLNGSTAAVQTASFPTAAAAIGWKPIGRAFQDFVTGKTNVNLKIVNAYTSRLWERSQGFTTHEAETLKSQEPGLPKGANWIQAMDVGTTTLLWSACEYYVEQTMPELAADKGSDQKIMKGESNFYKAVAEAYNNVIELTQPSYGTMERSQILRSESDLVRMTNMFKTQMYQNFNILYDAIGERNARVREYSVMKDADTKEALHTANVKFANAVTSQFAASLMAAFIRFGWGLLFRKDDRYRDEEGKLSLPSVGKRIALDTVGLFPGIVAYGSLLSSFFASSADSILKSLDKEPFFNESFYGVEVAVFDEVKNDLNLTKGAIASIISFANNVYKGLEDEEGNISWQNLIGKVLKAGTGITQLAFGFPVKNLTNLLRGMAQWSATLVKMAATGNYAQGRVLGDYLYLHLSADPKKDAREYYDLLFETGNRKWYVDPNGKNTPEEYRTLYRQMTRDGFEADKIQEAMRTRWMKTKNYSLNKDRFAGLLTGTSLASPAYWRLDETQREQLKENIQKAAQYETFRDYADGYSEADTESRWKWMRQARSLNETYKIPLTDLLILRSGTQDIVGIKETTVVDETEDGELTEASTLDNSKGLQIMEAAYDLFPEMEKWDEEKRQAVFTWLNVGKTIVWYDRGTVSNELADLRTQ